MADRKCKLCRFPIMGTLPVCMECLATKARHESAKEARESANDPWGKRKQCVMVSRRGRRAAGKDGKHKWW